ncbi:MAG: 5-(carboxyamino)imidazole ribonucleotide synthase [Rhizobiales bacterium]|nr:5-(carboxyamino)imidazole ribonucleotide synthase [Hyphomicrobiales bacterium]NRB14191.1 5-(carboxyamino)imidazole ribonucleotide synthase [Hyphomicrobiales bacterium]
MQTRPLAPNSVIGILGGGQLARMLSLAAAPLGYKTCIYCPEDNGPAIDVCHSHIVGDYGDQAKLKQFAAKVDVITYEFENIPASTIAFLNQLITVSPNLKSLQTSQDRLVEKDYLNSVGATTAPYANIATKQDLDNAVRKLGLPAILKTRTMGYDGKGQVGIKTMADMQQAYDLVSNNSSGLDKPNCILEGFINFDLEISVIIARDAAGNVAIFEPSENAHKNHILNSSTIPAQISPDIRAKACQLASDIIHGLDYVGVLGVETFITTNGNTPIIINEIAPRVHNSGHWTQDACYISQFEQHIRAIANLPLGSVARHSDVVMHNLIGDGVALASDYAKQANAKIHLYGKQEIKTGRKMGHVNLLFPLDSLIKT